MDRVTTSGMDNAALKQAEAFTTFTEILENLYENLMSCSNGKDLELRTELQTYAATVKSLIKAIDEKYVPTDIINDAKKSLGQSKVERLRLSSEIIRLKEVERLTFEQIATRVGLSVSTVSKFYKYYSEAKPTEKVRLKKASVFDSTQQLEDLHAMIFRQLERLEGDPENHVKYIPEARQVLKLAMDYIGTVNQKQEIENIKAKVRAILLQLAPEKRDEILKAFATESSVMGLLR